MDYLQTQLLALLPPPLDALAHRFLPYLSYLTHLTQYTTTTLLLPSLRLLTTYLRTSEQNPLLILLTLIVTLFLSLRVLGWIQRQIFAWIYLLVQIAVVVGGAGVAWAVWTFGAEECVRVLVRVGEALQGGREEGERGMEREGRRIRGGW